MAEERAVVWDMERDDWLEAVRGLADTIQGWAPPDVRSEREPYPEDPGANRLILSKGSRRVTLEPAPWDRERLPTSVDVYSNWGQRFRFRGPTLTGEWDVYTSDGVKLPTVWNRATVAGLLDNLLAVA